MNPVFAALLIAAAPAGPRPAGVTPAERAAAALIRPETLRARVGFLASDLLEGRGPASRGDRLTQAYLVSQMAAAGLEPAAPGGGWLQTLDIVGVTSRPPNASASGGARRRWSCAATRS